MKKLLLIITLLLLSGGSIQFTQSAESKRTDSTKNRFAVMKATLQNYLSRLLPRTPATPTPAVLNIDVIPLTHYEGLIKKLKLILVPKDYQAVDLTLPYPQLSWDDVVSYQLSPQKKYLLVNTAISLGLTRGTAEKTKIIDVLSLKEIAEFQGTYITHQFSPDELSIVVATAQKTLGTRIGLTAASKEGASETGERGQSKSGEILRYDLFDIPSQSILKTFENVQTAIYSPTSQVIVQFDDKSTKTITIQRNVALSFLQKILNAFIKQPTTHLLEDSPNIIPDYTAAYDLKNQTLTVTIAKQQPQSFYKVTSYSASPNKKHLLINRIPEPFSPTLQAIKDFVSSKQFNSATTVLDLITGKPMPKNPLIDIATSEFNPDETYLLFLAPAETPHYQTLSFESERVSEPFKDIWSAYFTPDKKLISISNTGKKSEIDITSKHSDKQKKDFITDVTATVYTKGGQVVQEAFEGAYKKISSSFPSKTDILSGLGSITRFIASTPVILAKQAYDERLVNQKEKEANNNIKEARIFLKKESDKGKDEIDSPEVAKEKLYQIIKISHQLNDSLADLPPVLQANLRAIEQQLITPAKQVIRSLIDNVINTEWSNNKTEIIQSVLPFVYAAATSVTANFALQLARFGTGNIPTISSNQLLIAGLSAVATTAITTLLQHTNLVQNTQTSSLTIASSVLAAQTIINPSVQAGNFTMQLPSYRDSLYSWIIGECFTSINDAFKANKDEIIEDISKMSLSTVITKKAPFSSDHPVVQILSPLVAKVVNDNQTASVIAEVSWLALQSGMIGALMHLSGLGYAETSIATSMGYAIVAGIAQGTIAYAIAKDSESIIPTDNVINIVTPPIVLHLAGASSETVLSAALQTAATAVADKFAESAQDEKTGLTAALQKFGGMVTETTKSRWSTAWTRVSNAWEQFSSKLETMAIPTSDEQTGSYLEEAGYGPDVSYAQ